MNAALQPWTIYEKVVCWEIWQADMSRVVLRIDKPTRLDEQPGVEAEARAIAAAPRLILALAALIETDGLINPKWAEAKAALAEARGDPAHAS